MWNPINIVNIVDCRTSQFSVEV